MCVFVLVGRIWDTTEAWWQNICMQLTNILKYEDKSLRLASWQHRLRWERANKLTTCRTSTVGPSWGKFERATLQTNGTRKKKKAVKATIKGNWSGSSFQSHPVRVLDYFFFNGGIRFSKTPSGHTLGVWMALFHFRVNQKCGDEAFLAVFLHVLCGDTNLLEYTLALVSCLITNILYLTICMAAF